MCLFCLSDKIAKNNPLYWWDLYLDIMSLPANVSIHYHTNISYFYYHFFALCPCVILHALSFLPVMFEAGYFLSFVLLFYCCCATFLWCFSEFIFPLPALGHMYVRLLVGMRNRRTFRARIFFKVKLNKHRTLYPIHPTSVLYLPFVFFLIEWLSVHDDMKINFQKLISTWILKAKMT